MNKSLVIGSAVFCIVLTLFVAIPVVGLAPEYDPWCDINGDGFVGIDDIFAVALHFGGEGEPINKTELLFEVQTARAHNQTFATSLESRSGYDWSWQDVPGMSVQVTLQSTGMLVIMFSSEAMTTITYMGLSVRAVVNAVAANPSGGVTLTNIASWASHSFTFFALNVGAGTHTVKIQWAISDEVGTAQLRTRTLIVTALLP